MSLQPVTNTFAGFLWITWGKLAKIIANTLKILIKIFILMYPWNLHRLGFIFTINVWVILETDSIISFPTRIQKCFSTLANEISRLQFFKMRSLSNLSILTVQKWLNLQVEYELKYMYSRPSLCWKFSQDRANCTRTSNSFLRCKVCYLQKKLISFKFESSNGDVPSYLFSASTK